MITLTAKIMLDQSPKNVIKCIRYHSDKLITERRFEYGS